MRYSSRPPWRSSAATLLTLFIACALAACGTATPRTVSFATAKAVFLRNGFTIFSQGHTKFGGTPVRVLYLQPRYRQKQLIVAADTVVVVFSNTQAEAHTMTEPKLLQQLRSLGWRWSSAHNVVLILERDAGSVSHVRGTAALKQLAASGS